MKWSRGCGLALLVIGVTMMWDELEFNADAEPDTLAILPVYESSDWTPQWYTRGELQQQPPQFPAFSLRDQAGRELHRDDLQGHIVVANFIFTGCSSLCPRLTSAMRQVQAAVRGEREVLLLSHSVTPQLDSPAVLAAYARSNDIDGEQWRVLTGAARQMSAVLQRGYLLSAAKGFTHTEQFVLLDTQLRVRGVYNGSLPLAMQQLVQDIRLLQAES